MDQYTTHRQTFCTLSISFFDKDSEKKIRKLKEKKTEIILPLKLKVYSGVWSRANWLSEVTKYGPRHFFDAINRFKLEIYLKCIYEFRSCLSENMATHYKDIA